MKRRPLRQLIRAERRVAAVLRGMGPLHRAGRAFRQPPSAEQRQEARARRFLQGWSQRKGGGWSIREAPWRPRVPETPCALPATPQDWTLPLVPWGQETGEPWHRLMARLRRVGASVKTWLRQRWRFLRYAELLPPAREATTTERVVGWSLAAAGVLVLTLILPRHIALWCAGLFGVVQMQLIDTGNANNDGQGDTRRVGGQKLNQNMMLTLMCAATLNVGWFAVHPDTGASLGLTAPQILQAAIDYGGANGFEAAWIPKKAAGVTLLPYDASAVTFNPDLRMMREKGDISLREWDVAAYGAALDRSTNDTAAVKAVIAAALAQPYTGAPRVIRFDGVAFVTEPILTNGHGLALIGSKSGYSTFRLGNVSSLGGIRADGFFGPALYVEGGTTISGLSAPLVGSIGQSWNAGANPSTTWWGLSDLSTMDLNGLSAFTVEQFYKGTGTDAHFISSAGSLYPGQAVISCFDFRTTPGGPGLNCTLTLSGGSISANGGTINDNAVHHIAASYDASFLRLFVDGTQVASVAGSGTLIQKPWETVTLGAPIGQFPEINQIANGTGICYSPRLSNAALYTSSFTAPNANLPAIGSTLGVVWFDEFKGLLTKVRTSGATGWAHYQPPASSGSVYGFTLEDFTLQCGNSVDGVMLGQDVEFWAMRRCMFASCRRGVYGPKGNHFQWRMEQCFFNQPVWMSVALGLNSGIGQMDTVWTFGGKLPYVLAHSGNLTLNNVYAVCAAAGVNPNYGAFVITNQNVSSGPPVLNGCKVDAEAGLDAAKWTAGLIFSDSIQCNGCQFETQNAAPYLIGSIVRSAGFRECGFFQIGSTPASVMTAVGTFTRPVKFDDCDQQTIWTPWSNVAGTATVGKIGKGTAIAFSTTPSFDCSLRDEPELGTMTATVTAANLTNATPGQSISIRVVQDGPGGRGWTFGTVNGTGAVKGASAIDTASGHWSLWVLEIGLDGNAYQHSFNSGA